MAWHTDSITFSSGAASYKIPENVRSISFTAKDGDVNFRFDSDEDLIRVQQDTTRTFTDPNLANTTMLWTAASDTYSVEVVYGTGLLA